MIEKKKRRWLAERKKRDMVEEKKGREGQLWKIKKKMHSYIET